MFYFKAWLGTHSLCPPITHQWSWTVPSCRETTCVPCPVCSWRCWWTACSAGHCPSSCGNCCSLDPLPPQCHGSEMHINRSLKIGCSCMPNEKKGLITSRKELWSSTCDTHSPVNSDTNAQNNLKNHGLRMKQTKWQYPFFQKTYYLQSTASTIRILQQENDQHIFKKGF